MAFQISPGVNVSEIDLTTVVPNVSTTAGAFAGIFSWGPVNLMTLVDSEATLAATFGKPTDANYETFFTAANFLSYGNTLYAIRVIDGANNAFANTGPVTSFAIKNYDDFSNTTLSSNVTYVAKYPGSLGNSIKVSVCDSANGFEEVVSVNTFTASFTNTTSFAVQSNTGSNTLSVTIQANTAGVANAAAQTLSTYLTVGDLIEVGNSTLGLQTVTVTAVTPSGTETSNGGTYTTTSSVAVSAPILLPANVNQTTITSKWEYSSLVDRAPKTSNFLAKQSFTAVDELHVVVVDKTGLLTGTPGTVLEVFKGLSRATDAKTDDGASNYYKTVLNNTSQYIWVGADRSGAVSNTAANVSSSTNRAPYTVTLASGGDGNGEANCALSALTSGYDMFKNPQDVDISLVLAGKARGVTAETTAPSSSSVNYSTMANYIIGNITEYRKDCVAFISPAKPDSVVQVTNGDAITNSVAFRNNLSTSSSYAVMDSGYKWQYDKYNDVRRWVPLNGDVAGTCVRTDDLRDPWFSPAGIVRGQIKNVIKLATNPGQAQRDALYKADINPVVTFNGQGTILNGDKTLLGRPSAFDRINVRRLFIVLEKAIANAAKSSLFEFNDEYTRAQFRNLVEPFLFDVKGRRGIIDFKVVCDDTNNTSQVIDSNQFVGDIFIKPAKSINFIQLNFVAVRSGVEFSEIVGAV